MIKRNRSSNDSFMIVKLSVYSVSIFCKLGVDGYVGTVVLMSANFCAQIFGIFIISKVHCLTRHECRPCNT